MDYIAIIIINFLFIKVIIIIDPTFPLIHQDLLMSPSFITLIMDSITSFKFSGELLN